MQQVLPPPLPAGVIRDHTIVAEVVSVLLGSGFSKQVCHVHVELLYMYIKLIHTCVHTCMYIVCFVILKDVIHF